VLTRCLPAATAAAAAQGPGAATVLWETDKPYQPVLSIGAPAAPPPPAPAGGPPPRLTLRGLTLRHASKSVANNYAVFITAGGGGDDDGGAVALEGCDISSASGTGVCVEGASAPTLTACTVHDCPRYGVALFGGLSGEPAAPVLEGCVVQRNALGAALVRAGAEPRLARCTLAGGGGPGLTLADAGGEYEGNTISGRPGVALGAGAGASAASLAAGGNRIEGGVV